jgi:hypothetical protein
MARSYRIHWEHHTVSVAPREKCCPKCDGTSGYQVDAKVTYRYGMEWGDCPLDPDSIGSEWGLVKCLDCGAKFQKDALKKKGLFE